MARVPAGVRSPGEVQRPVGTAFGKGAQGLLEGEVCVGGGGGETPPPSGLFGKASVCQAGRWALGQDGTWARSRRAALPAGGPLISQQAAYSASPDWAGSWRLGGKVAGRRGLSARFQSWEFVQPLKLCSQGAVCFQRPLGGPLGKDAPDRPRGWSWGGGGPGAFACLCGCWGWSGCVGWGRNCLHGGCGGQLRMWARI